MFRKYLLVLLMATVSCLQLQAQTYWTDVSISRTEEKSIQTRNSRGLQLNKTALESILAGAPAENNQGTSGYRIEIPSPNGISQGFFVYEISLMEAPLAQRFPGIKTYRGYSADGKSRMAMSLTPLGLHVMVFGPEGQWFIDPIRVRNHGEIHQSYYRKNFIPDPAKRAQQHCGFDYRMNPNYDQKIAPQTPALPSTSGARVLNGGTRKTYRIAIAATGEYTAFFGGTVVLGQAAIVATINRVSAVYEGELAIRLNLVANNSLLVYTNSTTDPFNNNDATVLIGQSQSTITTTIGTTNYDIGHTFSTGAGGLAGLGVACNSTQKGRGVTGSPAPVGDPYDIDYVAHEVGHQFGANHTFNGNQVSCAGGNRNASTAYEPGSGTTIMAYAGICGTDDLASNSDPYFHLASLQEIYTYTTTGTGSSCPATASTGNTPPNFVITHFQTHTIPPSTPFELVGRAADLNNDALTYCWEQYDLGATGSPTAPSGTMPHFRSLSPTSNPVRSFPKLTDVLANSTSLGEVMVNYNRSLRFRLTVRDNRANGGGIVFMDSNLTVTVSTGSSAFSISNLNTATSLQVGNSFNLTWNAGNTASAPYNATNVMVLLSTDGGITFPDTILTSTPNDGSQNITIPNKITTVARIKVKAVGNVFYDINNSNFTISAAVANTLTTGTVPATICAGTSFNLAFNATGTFNANNVFTAQLSNGTGSFTTPVTIGTLTGTSSGNISVTIPSGTVVGTGYRIRVVSSNPSLIGIDNGSNISINNQTPTPLPFTQNFNALSSGIIPAGWNAEISDPTSDFSVNGATAVNHGAGNTPGFAGNLWSSNTSIMATLPAVGLITTSSRFSFDYRVVNWGSYPNNATLLSNNDSLLLEASPDCGITWVPVYLINGATHTSNLNFQSINVNLNISGLPGNNVQFRFRGVWATGDYWWDIDNISIVNVPLLLSSVSPTGTLCTGASITANFATGITFNTGNVFRLELSDATGSFSSPVILSSQAGTTLSTLTGVIPMVTTTGLGYRVRISSTNPSSVSDSSTTLTIVNRSVINLPLSEDFNTVAQGALPVGWEAEANSVYDFRVDGNPAFAHGVGGTRGMAGNLWSVNSTVSLTLPQLGPIYPGSKISFDYRLVNFSGYTTTQVAAALSPTDTLAIEVSTDCALTWTRISSITQANHNTTLSFINKSVSLDAYAGQNILVRFFGKWGAGDYWWDLDNVSVTDGGPIVIDTVLTKTNWCPGQSVSVNYTLPGTFPSSNVLSLELSDRLGSFTGATVIATANGMGTGTLTGTLPNGLSNGYQYQMRVVASFLNMTGTTYSKSFILHPTFNGTVSQTPTTTTACSGQTIGFTASSNFSTANVPGVSYFPYAPNKGDSIVIYYSNPTATSAILHWAVNGWTGPDPAYIPAGSSTIQHPAVRTNMTALGGGRFRIAIGPFNNASQIVNVMDFTVNYFQGSTGFWDNNNSLDYHIEVSSLSTSSFAYQWKLNNNSVGNGSNTYSSSSLVNNDSVWVLATLSNVCKSVDSLVSNKTKLTINPNLTPSVSISGSSTTFCFGTLVTFTATPTNGGPSPSYQWRVNGNPVGTNSATFSTSTLSNSDVVSLVMTANNACQTTASATSNNVTVTVNPNLTPTVSISTANTTLCSGVNATFNASLTNGGLNPVFQWKLNGNNVGSNSNSYSNNALSNGDVVSLVVTANNTCQTTATANSNSLTMTINPTLVPSVSVVASSSTICTGTNVTFTATTTNGGSTPAYQWKLNGNNVGSNSATYSNNSLSNGDIVRVVMTSANTCQTTPTSNSNAVTMVVNPFVTPDVTIAASANPICSGSNVTFTATPVNGGSIPAYQWLRNGNPVGSNAATYSSSTLSSGDVIKVILTANNSCQTRSIDTSNLITISVQSALVPSVSIATANTTICSGTSATFTATPVNGGASPSYQWRLNGNPVGSNSATYSNSSLANGDVVSLVMTSNNTCQTTNTSTSNSLNMNIITTLVPSVSVAASSSTICSGTNVTFTATPTNGGSTPAYQWKLNGNNVGSNSATYSNNSLSNGDAVSVVMTSANTCQTTPTSNSNAVTMIVNPSVTPDVTIAASANPICSGSNVTFTATPVNGGSIPAYQWLRNGNPVGSNAATYSSSTISSGDVIKVILTANNSCQTRSIDTSNLITMSVQSSLVPSVSIATANTTICAGTSATFTATPVNAGTSPSYQWRLNGNPVGSNSATYSNSSLANGDVVSLVMTSNNPCQTTNTSTSNSLNMIIITTLVPSVSVAASSSTICSGTNVTFTATPTNGGSTPAYQWKLNGNNVGNNSATYSNNSLSNGDAVSVVMTSNNLCQTTPTSNSNAVTMTVNPTVTPDVTIAASANPICISSNVTFTATPVNGGSIPVYQWLRNGNPVGSNATTYSSTALTTGDVIKVILTANNTCQTRSSDTSNLITMSVLPALAPSVSIATANTTICAGTSTTFTATPVNGGASPTYQWRLNGNPVGSNSATYSNSSLASGDVVSLVMTSNYLCRTANNANSNTLTMTVTPNVTPVVSISASGNPICAGDQVTFTANLLQGGNSPSYLWTINGNTAGSGTSLTTSALVHNDVVQLVVTANNTCQTTAAASSNSVTMSVNPRLIPGVSISSGNLSACIGTVITFTATPVNGGSNPQYQWKVNGNPTGTNSSTFSSSSLSNQDVVTVTLSANNTCQTTSLANSNSLTATILQPSSGAITRTICAGQSIVFNGSSISIAGTYRDTLVNAAGCDSVLTLTLLINQPSSSSLNASICAGQLYNFNGNSLTSAGVYRDTLVNAAGCDSVVTLTLNLLQPSASSLSASICNGDSYNFNGNALTVSGVYLDTLVNAAGCDSVITLTLNVKATSSSNIQAGICPGASYNFNGTLLSVAGTYFDTLTNVAGCDSIITLTLNSLQPNTGNISAGICPGASFNFNGTLLTVAGTYFDTLTNAAGCDSIITLTLNALQPNTGNISAGICPGASYNFNGTLLSVAGTYFDTLTNAAGCDSIITLTLNALQPNTGNISAGICPGASYNFNGTLLSVAGTYFDTLTNASGCDSIITLTLNDLLPTNSTINASVCQGSSYNFNGTLLNTAGTYFDTLVNSAGCDSLITLVLNINQPSTSTLNASVCQGGSYDFNGTILNAAGTYLDTLVNASGCDSIVTLTLNVNQPSASSLSASICAGQSYNFNGTPYTSAGVYLDTLVNTVGCDSVITLTLNLLQPTTSSQSASICNGQTYQFNGIPLVSAGVYLDTLVNAAGCDSVITLTLNVNQPSAGSISATICTGAVYNFNGTSLSVAGTYSDTLVNAAGCDSVITLTLNVTPVLQSAQQASICAGNAYNFNGMMLTTAGTYRDTLQNVAGCDSLLITLTLNVNAVTLGNTSASICQGQTYPFNNQLLTTSGSYRDTLVNSNGCDSILTLTLTVNPIPTKPVITRNGNDLNSSASAGNQWYLVGSGAIAGATNQLYTPNQPNGGSFYVISTVNGCSSPSSDTLEFIGTGLAEQNLLNWQYFPNPASQFVNVRLELAKADQIRIDITDLSGRIVRSVYEGERTPGLLNLEVPTADLSQGMYLIRLSGKNEQRSGRLLIQR